MLPIMSDFTESIQTNGSDFMTKMLSTKYTNITARSLELHKSYRIECQRKKMVLGDLFSRVISIPEIRWISLICSPCSTMAIRGSWCIRWCTWQSFVWFWHPVSQSAWLIAIHTYWTASPRRRCHTSCSTSDLFCKKRYWMWSLCSHHHVTCLRHWALPRFLHLCHRHL